MTHLQSLRVELWRLAQIVFWVSVLVPYLYGVLFVEWCYERAGREPWWWTPPADTATPPR